MFRVFLLTLFFSFFNVKSYASVISEDNDNYFVKGVKSEGVSFKNEQSTKQIAISQAKQIAFSDLIKYTKEKNNFFDETNINSLISEYTILDEYYNENFYTLIADFTFNKKNFKSFLSEKNDKNDETVDYVLRIQEKDDIIAEYSKLIDFLKSEKIVFLTKEITSTEVSILLKNVNKSRVYHSLKKLKLNGKLYIEN